MFSHAAIASLNNLEMLVYNYVIKNRDKVMYMTIRELADAVGVSTTTTIQRAKYVHYNRFRRSLMVVLGMANLAIISI